MLLHTSHTYSRVYHIRLCGVLTLPATYYPQTSLTLPEKLQPPRLEWNAPAGPSHNPKVFASNGGNSLLLRGKKTVGTKWQRTGDTNRESANWNLTNTLPLLTITKWWQAPFFYSFQKWNVVGMCVTTDETKPYESQQSRLPAIRLPPQKLHRRSLPKQKFPQPPEPIHCFLPCEPDGLSSIHWAWKQPRKSRGNSCWRCWCCPRGGEGSQVLSMRSLMGNPAPEHFL